MHLHTGNHCKEGMYIERSEGAMEAAPDFVQINNIGLCGGHRARRDAAFASHCVGGRKVDAVSRVTVYGDLRGMRNGAGRT